MKYKDLPDSGNPQMTCVNEMCEEFHTLYSATRGDYFWLPTEAEVRCFVCGEEMYRAHEVRTIVIEGEELHE
jgi:hypothetical protein